MATTSTAEALSALTTIFTPAPSCLSNYHQLDYSASGFGQCTAGTSTFDCRYLHLGPRPTTACEPPGWKPGTSIFFSPGVCPSGYSEACSNVITAGIVTETRATCCPRYATNQCQSQLLKVNNNANWATRWDEQSIFMQRTDGNGLAMV